MRIELVKRPQRSALFSVLSPFIALGLTLIAGAIMFSILGKNPIEALYYYFIAPLSGLWNPNDVWQLHELAIKAAPLILIAVGLSICYPVQQLEHRGGRPVHYRRHRRLHHSGAVPDL